MTKPGATLFENLQGVKMICDEVKGVLLGDDFSAHQVADCPACTTRLRKDICWNCSTAAVAP